MLLMCMLHQHCPSHTQELLLLLLLLLAWQLLLHDMKW